MSDQTTTDPVSRGGLRTHAVVDQYSMDGDSFFALKLGNSEKREGTNKREGGKKREKNGNPETTRLLRMRVLMNNNNMPVYKNILDHREDTRGPDRVTHGRGGWR